MRLCSVLAWSLAGAALAAGCGSDKSPASPVPIDDPGAIARGNAAFLAACASCHASRDAFDLAFFGFPDSVIIRRATKHVSTETAREIAAYVRSLAVATHGRTFRLFQPTGTTAPTDGEFWTQVFAAPPLRWPSNLTADRIRAIDLRTVASALSLLPWSSEADDADWMPDNPLGNEVLDANGGSVRRLLLAYYATPTDAALLSLINEFRRVVRDAANPSSLCYGETGTQPSADRCFDAMRWMSSLSAVHLVRQSATPTVPIDIVRLWWDTGEAAVSTNFVPRNRPELASRKYRTAAWLYLAFSYAPTEFREENAYLGQFLVSVGQPHLAVVAALRRMVGEGRVHQPSASEPEWDGQRFWDGALAVTRAPNDMKLESASFVLDYLLARLKSGETYRVPAKSIINGALQLMDRETANAPASNATLRQQLANQRQQLDSLLSSAWR